MFKEIPHQRQLLYLLLAGLIPVILALFWFFQAKERIDEVTFTFANVQYLAAQKERKQAQNIQVRSSFSESDHFYIDKHLETLSFLEPEVEHLQKLVDGSLPISDNLRRRYEQLTGPQNALHFIEGQVRSYPSFQETQESLAHAVEINVTDLEKILSRVEGTRIGSFEPIEKRPQLIITDFKIDKKQVSHEHEVFLFNVKLLKREYI